MRNTILIFFTLISLSNLAFSQNKERYTVNSKTLNMRVGPGKEYKIVQSLSLGDTVLLIQKNDSNWWEVNFEGTTGYVYSTLLKIDPYSGWEQINYESGVTPECENIVPKYDDSLDNYLRIKVGSGTDVVVKLMRIGYSEDECIRIVYVRSDETYEIKNIPEGLYYLKIAYGKDYRKKIVDNICYVKFMKNALYEKGSQTLNFNKIMKPDEIIGNNIYKRWSIPSFELLLNVITKLGTKPTFNSNGISEAEFNR